MFKQEILNLLMILGMKELDEVVVARCVRPARIAGRSFSCQQWPSIAILSRGGDAARMFRVRILARRAFSRRARLARSAPLINRGPWERRRPRAPAPPAPRPPSPCMTSARHNLQ